MVKPETCTAIGSGFTPFWHQCKMARYIWNKERGTKRDRCKYVLLLSQTERDCPSAGNGNYIWQICVRDWPPYSANLLRHRRNPLRSLLHQNVSKMPQNHRCQSCRRHKGHYCHRRYSTLAMHQAWSWLLINKCAPPGGERSISLREKLIISFLLISNIMAANYKMELKL